MPKDKVAADMGATSTTRSMIANKDECLNLRMIQSSTINDLLIVA